MPYCELSNVSAANVSDMPAKADTKINEKLLREQEKMRGKNLSKTLPINDASGLLKGSLGRIWFEGQDLKV